jgi:hypothetical protein
VRPAHLALTVAAVLAVVTGCGDERAVDLSAHPAAGGNGVVAVEVVWLERHDDQLRVRLRLRNTSAAIVDIAPSGDRLAGYRALVAGRDVSALAEVDHREVAAAHLDGLPPAAVVELELTWELRPDVGRDDYPCTLVIGNLYQNDAHLDDVAVSIGRGAPGISAPSIPLIAPPKPDAPADPAAKPVVPPAQPDGVSL